MNLSIFQFKRNRLVKENAARKNQLREVFRYLSQEFMFSIVDAEEPPIYNDGGAYNRVAASRACDLAETLMDEWKRRGWA
jgi:hypothetical protein